MQTKSGEPEILLIHVEVQGKRNPDFAYRMWHYYSLIRSRYGKPVVPLVIYLTKGSDGIGQESYEESLLGWQFLRFAYLVVSLPNLSAEEWADKSGAVSAALATLMDSPRAKRAQRAFDSFKTVVLSPLPEAQKVLLSQMVERLGRERMSDTQKLEYTQLVTSTGVQEIKEMITTFEERGIEKGIEQGIMQGIEQGELRLTLRLLTRKFGTNAIEPLRPQIEALPLTLLESFSEAILDFTQVSDAHDWLANHNIQTT